MFTDISIVAGLLGLIVSTLLLVKQTRAATEQAKISNSLAGVSTNHAVLASLREVHLLLVDRPALRAYFYDGVPCPQEEPERSQVIMIAELLADVLSSGVHSHQSVPNSDSDEPWTSYCRHTLSKSPALYELVQEHPDWWPCLHDLIPRGPSA